MYSSCKPPSRERLSTASRARVTCGRRWSTWSPNRALKTPSIFCFVPLVRLRHNAALASKAHPAQTDHRVMPARMALQEKAPALPAHRVATLTSMNVSCQFHLSAPAKLLPAQLVPQAHLAQTAARATQAATDAMDRTVHQAQLDHQDHQELQATLARRAQLASQAPSPPDPSHHRAHLVLPASPDHPEVRERLVPPAKTATTVHQANLVSLVNAAHPAETASPDRQENPERPAPQAAATTAHQLVWPQDINFLSPSTSTPSVHLGWLLLLLPPSIFKRKNSPR